MLQREESRHDFAFIAGVIIGAVAGAVATLALTPMSGNETREMVRSRVGEMDNLKEKASSVKEKATERASNVAHQAQPMMDKVKTQVTDMAAKSPLPVGGDESDDGASTDGAVTEMNPAATTPTVPPVAPVDQPTTRTTPPIDRPTSS